MDKGPTYPMPGALPVGFEAERSKRVLLILLGIQMV